MRRNSRQPYLPLPVETASYPIRQPWRFTPRRMTIYILLPFGIFVYYIILSRPQTADTKGCLPPDHFRHPFDANSTFFAPESSVHYRVVERDKSLPKPHSNPTNLPHHCLDSHFLEGAPCHSAETTQLDFVWTWVNSTDPLFSSAITTLARELIKNPQPGKIFSRGSGLNNYR